MNVSDLVSRYLETWNETDPAARRKAIDELWAPDGVYTDPISDGRGPGPDRRDHSRRAGPDSRAGVQPGGPGGRPP